MDQLLKAYPKDLKFVYKQMPLPMHSGAMPAAKASLAAGNQGKFWEMHDELFKRTRDLGKPDTITEAAKGVGLDMKKFEKDMGSPEIEKLVQEDVSAARAADVTGTPTMFLNGKRVMNRSFDGIKAMIDEELKKKGG